MNTLIRTEDGGPRVRLTDPLESHAAADASQGNIQQIKDAVLQLIFDLGPSTGKELNRRYRELWESRGYPQADDESPRKRAGELVADGLAVRLPNENGRGAYYSINLDGFNRLGAIS